VHIAIIVVVIIIIIIITGMNLNKILLLHHLYGASLYLVQRGSEDTKLTALKLFE